MTWRRFSQRIPGDDHAGRFGRRPRHWLVRRPYRVMLAVALAQVFGTNAAGGDTPSRLDLVISGHRLPDIGLLLLTVAAAALLFSRPSPKTMLVVATVPTVLYYALGFPDGPAFLAATLAVTMAVTRGYRRFAWSTVAAGYLAYLLIALVLRPGWAVGSNPATVERAFSVGMWVAVCLGLAEALRIRAVRAAEAAQLLAEQRKSEAERERAEAERTKAEVERSRAEVEHARATAEQARRQASEERLRIAGELHDVIGHHLSLINVQAGVGLHLMDQQPEQARESLTAIKLASAEALRETRAVLATLQGSSTAPRTPAAGIAELGQLVAEATSAGLPVTLSVGEDLPEVPVAVDMAAYRIVREALTNVRRHAGTVEAVTVTVRIADRGLEVRVVDDGTGLDSPPEPGWPGGTGLAGMRERAAALGGRVEAGPRPDGGFAVLAVFPLERLPLDREGQQA